MKKLFFVTLLVALGVAGNLIYTSKPEAKSASTRNFRINLKDGRVTANDDGFGRFNEWNSGPFGRATDDDINCLIMFPGQRNWNATLSMFLECANERIGPYNKEYFYLNATGYDKQGHSSGTFGVKSSIDGNHWRVLCSLYVENLNYAPITSRDAITSTDMWRVYGLVEEFYPSTCFKDTLHIESNWNVIDDRIRITGTNPVNFDVKILPVNVLMQTANGIVRQPMYRKSVSYH